MHFLAIDQGNTRTKCGLFRDGGLQQTWAVATEKTATAADLATAVLHLPTAPDAIGLSTVVPELLPAWQQMATEHRIPLTRITGQTPTSLVNAYATPETLGPDRLMAAVAAAAVALPVIPISLGTATVVDAVDADGRYRGGMIAPGIGVAVRALTAAASALWQPQWRTPDRAIGQSSGEAMANGLFYQAVGGLRLMIQATRDELGTAVPLVLTGGWAAQLAPHLEGVALVDESLVLRGIAQTLAVR